MRKDEKSTVSITLLLPEEVHRKLRSLQSIRRIMGEKVSLTVVTIDKLRDSLQEDVLLKRADSLINELEK